MKMIGQHGTLEISRERLAHNVALLRRRVGAGVRLCATIKADAYGHGVAQVAPLLLDEGVRWACVYSLNEAPAVASLGWEGILVLSPVVLLDDVNETSGQLLRTAMTGAVRLNVTDAGSARRLAAWARGAMARPVKVHIQVDAGLTRVGAAPREAEDLAELIAELPGLELEGLFAHFSHGDVPGHETVGRQMGVLRDVAARLRKRFSRLLVHLQNSGGAWHVETPAALGLDMVRVGIALYGLQPSIDDPIPGLQPIARVTAPIVAVHRRPAGTGVGYGHTYVTRRESVLGIVPVGYADGYPRQLSNRSVAQVRGKDVPVVGRVSMDQIILDLTYVMAGASPEAFLGERVTAISSNPRDANSIDAMATAIGTIGYELATHFGGRLARVVVD